MRFEYISVYKLFGVNLIGKKASTEIANIPEIRATAIITDSPDEYCFNADRGNAIIVVIAKKFAGQLQEEDFKFALENEILSIRKERNQRHNKGTFLVFRATGEMDSPLKDAERTVDFEGFAVCLGQSKLSVRECFKDSVNGVLAAITLALDTDNTPYVENIIECTYRINPDGKIFYSLHASGSATDSLASPLTLEAEQFVGQYAQKLGEDTDISRVSRLLVQSLQTGPDNLRAFLLAWTALEIFVNKASKVHGVKNTKDYKDYKEARLQKDHDDMDESKWALFIGLSALLAPETAVDDQEEFKKLKKTRNNLIHPLKISCEIADADLPTIRVQQLLRKYLRLYIEKPMCNIT